MHWYQLLVPYQSTCCLLADTGIGMLQDELQPQVVPLSLFHSVFLEDVPAVDKT
jgi:hypothetical protein